MEVRIVRLVATLGFFGFVSATALAATFIWGYLAAGVLFGAMSAFLWKDEVQALLDRRENARITKDAEARMQGADSPHPGAPNKSWLQ